MSEENGAPVEAAIDPTLARVDAALGGLDCQAAPGSDGMVCVETSAAELHAVLERLRDAAGFVACTLVTAVDRQGAEPRFEVVHQLLSTQHADRVRVRTRVGGDDPAVPTCVDLWPGAGYSERECYDMFGVRFEGHENLRRLLMPQEYEHHPLRKDFPHFGIEPDKLYRQWDAERRKHFDPGK